MGRFEQCSLCAGFPSWEFVRLPNLRDAEPDEPAARREAVIEACRKQLRGLDTKATRFFTCRVEGGHHDFCDLYACPECGTFYGYGSEYSEDGPGNVSSEVWVWFGRVSDEDGERVLAADRAAQERLARERALAVSRLSKALQVRHGEALARLDARARTVVELLRSRGAGYSAEYRLSLYDIETNAGLPGEELVAALDDLARLGIVARSGPERLDRFGSFFELADVSDYEVRRRKRLAAKARRGQA